MKEITDVDELKRIELDLLKKVFAFCKARGIRCYLGGGTLLGSVRHKGFIPWDDDVDVMMPRPDYEKFCSEFSMPDASVHCFRRDQDYYLPFAKVYDDRTALVEDRDPHGKSAVYVDVFPIDGFKNHDVVSNRVSRELNRCMAFLSLRRSPPLFRRRPFMRQIGLWIGLPLRLLPQSWRNALAFRALDRFDRFLSSSVFDSAPFAAVAVCDFTPKKIVPKRIFDPGPEMRFEDSMFTAPAGWQENLSSLYGDYMVLPAPEKRITHHSFRAWWK